MIAAAPLAWDEACFAVPALRALAASGLLGCVLCRPEQKGFWARALPESVEVIAASPRRGLLGNATALGSSQWQASLVWEKSGLSQAFARAGIARRLGPSHLRLGRELTDPIDCAEEPFAHRVQLYLKTCTALGIDTRQAAYFAPAQEHYGPKQPRTALLCPGSDYGPSYEWPLEYWIHLAQELISAGYKLTIAGTVGGRGYGLKLAEQLGRLEHFFVAAPLAATLPLLGAHELVVACDGSLPHLAAHAGATCAVIFGPSDPSWRRPLGKHHVIIRRHVECAPCLHATCLMKDHRCLRELSPALASKALAPMLG